MEKRIKSLMMAIVMLFTLTSCSNLSKEEKESVQAKLSDMKVRLIQLDSELRHASISNLIYLHNAGIYEGMPVYPTVVQEIVLDNVKYLVDAHDYTKIVASNYLDVSLEGDINTQDYYLVIKYEDHVEKISVFNIQTEYSQKLIKSNLKGNK